MDRIIWEVTLEVGGPIKIGSPFNMRHAKGFDMENQFYSDIHIKNSRNGITANITAYAPNEETAYKAALYFFGTMVDVLSYKIDLPLYLYYFNPTDRRIEEFKTKRLLSQEIIDKAFIFARECSMDDNKFALLRSCGWYRKGIMSSDPIERFLALWNVVESLGSKYHTQTERTRNGAINQIYQCFLDYFGEESNWGLADRWINNMHELRSQLAHGGLAIDIHTIEEVAEQNATLKNIAYSLLTTIIGSISNF